MRILYVFPHPDDEAFGPSVAMSQQIVQGHEVFLLTLTKGGATQERHRFGYSILKMGTIREKELRASAKVIGLSGLRVCDYPDGGLKLLDPRILEGEILQSIDDWQPQVLVSYAVHGISGHHDHLVCHAVVKMAFLSAVAATTVRRLAFYTSPPPAPGRRKCFFSTNDEIDCLVTGTEADRKCFLKTLECYATYQDRIERSGITRAKHKKVYFEFFGESFENWLDDLTKSLPDK
ncbi:MAG: PIG-L deacetylase family protein [Calditrichia bacterium]